MKGRGAGSGPDVRQVEHPDQFLARLDNGGFVLETDGQPAIKVAPCGDGWSVTGIEGRKNWTLQRADAEVGGFVLQTSDGAAEAGRTMPLVGTGWTTGPRCLLLDDGRLFRIVRRGPRDDGFDLLGWEMPGEYLRARPEPEGWRLIGSAACSGLTEINVIVILFAAEILDAEQRLQVPTP